MTLKVIIQCVVDLRMNCRLESCLTCFRKTCDENHDGDDVYEREDDVCSWLRDGGQDDHLLVICW